MFMPVLKKINNITRKIEELILSYGIILLAGITMGNVVSRKFFNHSWSFTEEVSQFILVIITFIGVGYAARKSRHIRMTAFYDMIGEKLKKVIILIVSFFTMLLMFYLAYYAMEYTLNVMETQRLTPVLRLPFYLVVIWVPVGFVLGGIQYFLTFVKNLTEKKVWISFEEQTEYKKIGKDISMYAKGEN